MSIPLRGDGLYPFLEEIPGLRSPCLHTASIVANWYSRSVKEAIQLFDLSLLKMSPFYWKNNIYNQGFLFFSAMVSNVSTAKFVLDDLGFIAKFSEKMTIEGERKTAKFIHLLSTHPPFILNGDCKMDDRAAVGGPMTAANVGDPVTAAKCSLREIAKALSRLKAESAFDNALVIILADHGGMRPIPSKEGLSHGLASLMAFANPALIVRLPGAHAPLHENEVPVSIADVAATVCEVTASCTALGGKPLQHANAESSGGRRRIFNHYFWKAEYASLSKMPNVRAFEITGNVRDPASWRDIGPRSRLPIGGAIDFRDAAPDQYLGIGWSGPEPWGRWTEGSKASLRLLIDHQSGSDLVLYLRARALIARSKTRQDVTVHVNSLRVGEWVFDEPGIFEKWFRIPASAFRQDGILDIEFEIGSPESPRNIGLNNDPRMLGIGLSDARITAN